MVPFCHTKNDNANALFFLALQCSVRLWRNEWRKSSIKIGYARVSTDDQNLDLQMDALHKVGCEKIFTDHGVSGISVNRVGLSQAIAAVGAGDVLVVWKLDRLGRSLSFLIELIEKLRNDQAGFESLSDGINTTTAGGKLVFHILGALAEFERPLISERSKARVNCSIQVWNGYVTGIIESDCKDKTCLPAIMKMLIHLFTPGNCCPG